MHRLCSKKYKLGYCWIAIALACRCLEASSLTIDGWGGLRVDWIDWNIGGDEVDIISELTWKKLYSWEAGLSVRCDTLGGWVLKGLIDYGPIFQGEMLDSDFDESGRQQEYSRSLSRTRGYVADGVLSMGRLWPLQQAYLTSLYGLSGHRQYLRNDRGTQILDRFSSRGYRHVMEVNEPFEEQGVHSIARHDWFSLWYGLEFYKPYSKGAGWLDLRFHSAFCHIYGEWLLREDFTHFHKMAFGWGIEGRFRIGRELMPKLEGFGEIRGQWWFCQKGIDRVYQGDEYLGAQRLNGAHWQSVALVLGLKREF